MTFARQDQSKDPAGQSESSKSTLLRLTGYVAVTKINPPALTELAIETPKSLHRKARGIQRL